MLVTFIVLLFCKDLSTFVFTFAHTKHTVLFSIEKTTLQGHLTRNTHMCVCVEKACSVLVLGEGRMMPQPVKVVESRKPQQLDLISRD